MFRREGGFASRLVLASLVTLSLLLSAPATAQQTNLTALANQMRALYQAGKYAEGIPIAERVVATVERLRGQNNIDYAQALQFLGEFYRAAGRYAEAETILKRGLTIAERLRGASHPDLVPFLSSLGDAYRWQVRYREAEPLYRRALAIQEKTLGPSHHMVAAVHNQIGLNFALQGRHADAERSYRTALAIVEKPPGRGQNEQEHTAVLFHTLMNLGDVTSTLGRYAEAEQHLQRAHTTALKISGPNNPILGRVFEAIAKLRVAQGRLADAIAVQRQSLAIYEKGAGQHDPVAFATSLNVLGQLLSMQGNLAEAEQMHGRALLVQDKLFGKANGEIGATMNFLAMVYAARGRLGEAEDIMKRATALIEKELGPNHSTVGILLTNQAGILSAAGRYRDAEALLKRVIRIVEVEQGAEHRNVGQGLANLAGLYRTMGRYSEAENLLRRSVEIVEKALGRDHPDVADPLAQLAQLYAWQGRPAEAELLFKRALAMSEAALGRDHPMIASLLVAIGAVHAELGRFADAELAYRRALTIREKVFGPSSGDVADVLHNLGILHIAQRQLTAAESGLKRALAIREKILPAEHALIGENLTYLGLAQLAGEKLGEAEPTLMRAWGISEKVFERDHPFQARIGGALASIYFAKGDYSLAVNLAKRAAGVLVRRTKSTGEAIGRGVAARVQNESASLSRGSRSLVLAAHRLAEIEPARAEEIEQEMFLTAQNATGTEAAASLAQMAARQAAGDSALARLVRERQDLVTEWRSRDGQLTEAIGKASAARNAATEQIVRDWLAAIGKRMAEIDRSLARDFPQYTALTNPEPMSLSEAQRMLAPNEALLVFLDAPEMKPLPEATFLWVVTSKAVRWVKTPLGMQRLNEAVFALRCGLDASAWSAGRYCPDLLRVPYSLADRQAGRPLPFDLTRAHELYKALLSPVEDLIKDKHLLVVPSGALTALPLQVLVTEPPTDPANPAGVAWLGVRQPVTILPSVTSLRALRATARPSRATRPFIGFGNPLLDGNPGISWQTALARQSREQQRCTDRRVQVAALTERRGAIKSLARGGVADIAEIRRQVPLPETADELCAIAETLGLPDVEVKLGASATERELKALSASGRLAEYRVVHFATHGALSGEVGGNAEPGLILTPPDKASEAEDGYLTASEISQMNLDADWVILSACNTAGGGTEGGEAMSGLARAFFYAGARALLVSHWAVDSAATVRLVTRAFAELQADQRIGRAEAMRRSVVALINSGETLAAHPMFWAPFVVVGEGAR